MFHDLSSFSCGRIASHRIRAGTDVLDASKLQPRNAQGALSGHAKARPQAGRSSRGITPNDKATSTATGQGLNASYTHRIRGFVGERSSLLKNDEAVYQG